MDPATRRLFDDLDLPVTDTGVWERFPVPPTDPATGHGRSLAASRSLRLDWTGPRTLSLESVFAADQPADLHFLRVRPSQLEQTGLLVARLDEAPAILRVSHPSLPLRVAASDPSAFKRIDDGSVGIDLTRGPVLIKVATAAALFEGSALEVRIRAFPTILLNVRSLAIPRPPVVDWMATCKDAWLQGEIARLVEAGDDWSMAAAAGLFARMAPAEFVTTPGQPPVLAGLPPSHLPATWARALDKDAIHALGELALSEIVMLAAQLDALAESVPAEGADEAGWVSDVIEFCRRRDDLASVQLLLVRAGQNVIDEELEQLDTHARPFVAIGLDDPMNDTRLTRVAREDPDAWWAAPFLPPRRS